MSLQVHTRTWQIRSQCMQIFMHARILFCHSRKWYSPCFHNIFLLVTVNKRVPFWVVFAQKLWMLLNWNNNISLFLWSLNLIIDVWEKEVLALKNLMGLTFEILEIKKKLLKVNCTNRCRKMFLLEKTFVFIEIRVTKSNKNC